RANIRFSVADSDGGLYLLKGFRPYTGLDHPVTSGQFYSFNLSGASATPQLNNFNFGGLYQTLANNPNRFTAVAVDEYGLMSQEVFKTAQVVPMPEWMTSPGSSMTFDPASHQYL